MRMAASRQRGFNTVEILVGMSILVIGVVIAGGYFKYNQKASKRSDAFYLTTQLASARLEQTKRRLSNPDTLKTILAEVGAGDWVETGSETLQGKVYQVSLRYRRLSPSGNLMKVKATVFWDGGKRNVLGTVIPFTP
jgi:type II secretory pathway pseudopilin PulG